tara:strand:+ start:4163 stop:4501 length:339 start_codon:yes stop_codon:yes gene_type:complete
MTDQLNEIDRFRNEDGYINSFGYSKVSVTIEVESRMNYDKIYFSHKSKPLKDMVKEDFEILCSELFLNYCNDVFQYYYKNKETFKISDCVRVTGVSVHQVRNIYKKHIQNKE